MRIVPHAVARPNQCVVYPQLGSNHAEGYFDTGNELPAIDPHIYVSVAAAKEMARELGYVSGEDHAELIAELEAVRSDLDDALGQIGELDTVIDAIDTLESAEFRARKRPGRKPAKQPERSAV